VDVHTQLGIETKLEARIRPRLLQNVTTQINEHRNRVETIQPGLRQPKYTRQNDRKNSNVNQVQKRNAPVTFNGDDDPAPSPPSHRLYRSPTANL